MTQGVSWVVVLLVSSIIVSCTRAAHVAESCNQIELAPGGEAMVSVLLPDTAVDFQPQLMARDARDSRPVDAWGACPTTEPYGACAPAAHGDVVTVDVRRVVDPGDGKQLLGFHMKNGAGAPKRDVRLCVQHGMP